MPSTKPDGDERERQLDAIIAEYYRLSDTDGPPDQSVFVLQYPDFAAELKEYFSDARLFHAEDGSTPQDTILGPTIIETPRPMQSASKQVVRYFGEYEILEELGAGGMGVVYKARQKKLSRIVALKMIRSGELANSLDVQRFEAEAKAAAKLSHPGIVSVHEVGVHDGHHFYTMDYVEGGNLSQLHRDKPVPAKHAAKLGRQLAEAMHYAHLKGIVHRDLKPANILLTVHGEPKITDFGLAKRVHVDDESQAHAMTESGQILGTAGYMSPEQASGKSRLVGPSADVYSLGAVLYALLTSRAPFVGETPTHTIMQVLQNEPLSPRKLNPSVPQDLETICLKCLEKEPHNRYGTAQLLADDLQRFLEGWPVVARPISHPARAWRWCRRNSAVALLSFAIIMSLVLGTAISSTLAIIANQRGERLANSLAAQTELVRLKDRALLDLQREVSRNYIDKGVSDLLSGEISRGLIRLFQATQSVNSTDPEFAIAHKLIGWWSSNFGQPLRHSGEVHCVCISPNGEIIATGSQDRTLKLRDAHTGMPLCGPFIHDNSVFSAVFHPDGNMILTASCDEVASLWDTVNGSLIRQVVHGARVRQIMFSSDGEMFVTAGDNGIARIWETATGDEVGTPMLHEESIHCVAFSPDSSKLATGSRDNTARLWNVSSGKPIGDPLRHPDDIVSDIAFSPDGATLATGGIWGWVGLWDTTTGAALGQQHQLSGSVCGLVFVDEGRTLLAGSISGGLYRIEVSTGRLLKSRVGPTKMNGFTLGPTQKQFLSRVENQLQLWDLDTGQPLGEPMLHEDVIRDVRFSPDGRIAVSASADKSARIWDLTQNTSRHIPIKLDSNLPPGAAFCPEHARIVTAGRTARVLDTTNGELLLELKPKEGYFLDTIFSPDGKTVLTGGTDGAARLWDVETGEMISELLGHTRDVRSVAFSPDGTLIATGSLDKTVRLWKAEDNQQLGTPIILDGSVSNVAFSEDGSLLIASTTNQSHTVRIWDIKTRKSHMSLIQDAYGINSVAISPDCRYVLTGNSAGYASLWDIETGKKIGSDLPHRGTVISVAFSPDGESFVTCGVQDTEASLWDTKTLKPRRQPMQSGGPLLAVAFSSDGSQILTASSVLRLVNNVGYWLSIREWRIPPTIQSSPVRVKKSLEVMTGLRVDDQNQIQELSNQQLHELQQVLEDELGGPPIPWR
ncbi:protein kinase domain-containing protein [Novipirellula sp. SH528]|uniref:protein kinase domain-containing protein n=1 Tax=Novipirellula sp. SH528 TaxID=3454466 RepID=UPI003FA14081